MTTGKRPSTEPSTEPFFTDIGRGRRFAIASRPNEEPRGAILFLPPFAEEMNKSRRMTALAARALAEDGWYVLRFDLLGCGDSEGDIGDATWADWIDDVTFWSNWLRERTEGPFLLWGLRAGSLLAAAWLQRTEERLPLMMWQPVTSGGQHLTQFLRLRAAADMLDAREGRGAVAALKADLGGGRPVIVAGYTLSPNLGNPLASAQFRPPGRYDGALSVLEVVPNTDAAPTPALAKAAQTWTDAGAIVRMEQVTGSGFWRTTEIETVPRLIEATVHQARWLAE